MEDIKRGPDKGPVSMETVDKRVRLDVDAGKAVMALLKMKLYKTSSRAQFKHKNNVDWRDSRIKITKTI